MNNQLYENVNDSLVIQILFCLKEFRRPEVKLLLNKTRKNAIVEYPDYQIPVTQLKGPKGNGDMQAAKRD